MYKKLNQLKAILDTLQGLVFSGTCDTGMSGSTTTVVCAELANLGNDRFNTGYSMVVVKNVNSPGNAPENTFRDITDYVSSTGTFTVTAFGANIEEGDLIAVMKNELADWADGGRLDLILDAIVADTNELQTDWVNGGRLDLILDAIRAAQGAEFDGTPDMYDVLITGGIPAWPNAAAPANNISIAQVIREIYNQVISGAGVPLPFATTIDLHQAAGTYDICTATTEDIIIQSIIFSPRADVSDDVTGITAITIQTNTTTEQEFIDNVDGAIANLTAEAQISWEGRVLLRETDKIQFTIEGGTATADPTTCDIVIQYQSIVAGGTLA